MIDIENKVFDTVYNAVIAVFADAAIYGEYVEQSNHFPAVMINEVDNRPYTRSATEDTPENHAEITYEINVFSALQTGKKAQTKRLLDICDNAMKTIGFTREMATRVPNVDRTIYRIYARYTAVVSQPVVDGNNTTYNVYRR